MFYIYATEAREATEVPLLSDTPIEAFSHEVEVDGLGMVYMADPTDGDDVSTIFPLDLHVVTFELNTSHHYLSSSHSSSMGPTHGTDNFTGDLPIHKQACQCITITRGEICHGSPFLTISRHVVFATKNGGSTQQNVVHCFFDASSLRSMGSGGGCIQSGIDVNVSTPRIVTFQFLCATTTVTTTVFPTFTPTAATLPHLLHHSQPRPSLCLGVSVPSFFIRPFCSIILDSVFELTPNTSDGITKSRPVIVPTKNGGKPACPLNPVVHASI
ncbi:uncharacterized protein LACBIDRAFT_332231 [Laccaria bicolor S238N-H82]|uniref:Predicted protein n=1 Tax=Laccaria bicolor (strain S238N-H82 / ATCC MYA-4686) TaxID=486041 RepID=B0DS15_LACBS|nr:uncharacterized protein LACBIDRAFT_332231 [Laccaria bicolor S238N-H82]EDR02623.1 predicted protein [Laccaria bicolor S238N-H82]|eukprot:XP_001886667.1 predicted protein [Laccaria bicolor S238N-H82]